LGVIVYLFRFQFTEIIESTIGLEKVAEFIVYSASTFSIRAILFMGGVVFLGMLKWSINKLALSTKGKHILNAGITFIVIFLCFRYLLLLPDHILIKTFLVAAILFANTLPHEMLATIDPRKNHIHTFVIYGIGFAELLTPQIYLLWLADRLLSASNHQSKLRDSSWITGVVAAVLLWVFLLIPHENQRIFTLGEKLNYDPAVEKFAEGDFNWLEINSERRELYAVGPGLNFIMIFNMDQTNIPPRKAKTAIDRTQSFAFNPDLQEVYVYNNITRELLYLAAPDLTLVRTVPTPNLANGDVWVKWDRSTDTISISSEADLNNGIPFYLLDRESGKVKATMSMPIIPTAFIVFHPEKPIMYFNSFKDTYLVAWDMETHQIVRQAETSPRTDRMTFSPGTSEILVASPLEGAILRYDADTLEQTGKIKTSLGDRTITVDPVRDLLIVGNFFNNKIKVIDLGTEETIKTYHLGPWIRTIALDTKNGVAYVSTARNLFKVTYAEK
jgi:DNA-binding beta-propeller fold protein YncE